MADDLAALLEEQQRRSGQVTGGYRSVLAEPEQTTTLEETKRAVTSLLKGSTKGIIDLVGGWGKLYDVIKENKTPSALSGQGIVNAIAKAGGPDLMKIQGYKGAYDVGQAGAPAALMSLMAPGSSLFNLSTPARTVAAEFTTAGGLGLLSQQVAPESAGAQVAMQTLPYLVKGGVTGLQSKAQQKKIDEYRALLPTKDANTFSEFMLRGQGSSDPIIAADIARLASSPKYLELVSALNEGASAKAVSGMAPKAASLTQEQAKVGIIQSIQNKLEGIRDSKAGSLFEKAKGYGAGQGLVDPTITIGKIDELIGRYSAQTTPNAERAVEVLTGIRDRLSPSFTTQGGGGTTVVRQGEAGRTIPGAAGYSLTEAGSPSRNIPGSPSRTVVEPVTVTKYDSMGMPYQTTEMRTRAVPAAGGTTIAGTPDITRTVPSSPSTYIAGTPDVVMNIPGAQPYTFNRGPQKLTVEQVQGLLSEFGKKASAGDNLIKDLSISDERIISSAIFGGMKDDLATAAKNATGNDKAALNLLSTARDKVAKSAAAYNEAIAQGMPAFLHNKTLAEISPEELFKTYSGLTPTQRATMRSWVENTDQAALSVLDKQVFDDFVSAAKKPNATGVETVDLATLAKNWRGLDAISKDALVTALGTNATEFGKRMSDAELMTRKMRTSTGTAEATISPGTVRETSAVIGAAGGYGPAKLGQLSMDLVNSFSKNGLTEDQLMKALLTPEGASFLKNASLSPRSATVLDDLTKMENSNPVLKWSIGTAARIAPRAGAAEQPTVQTPQEAQQGQDDLAALLEEQARRQAGQ